jgi:hypothetical protein
MSEEAKQRMEMLTKQNEKLQKKLQKMNKKV